MRPSRLIYVENDPALRGIMMQLLNQHPEIEVVCTASSADEALLSDQIGRADVALIDLALGVDSMNGIDLGIALRERNPDIGIVIHSQYSLTHLSRRVPEELRMGWSFLQKSGDMSIDDLVSVLRAAAAGHGLGNNMLEDDAELSIDALTPRQRAVMALASSGLAAPHIAQRLGMSPESVRQDLSKSYKALVPDASEGDDLRTRAILTYLRLVRDQAWEDR